MKKLGLLSFLFSFFYVASPAQTKITVAVAADMQYAAEALKTEFQKTNTIQIVFVVGASGNLTQQILQGAPYDIFISADTFFTKKLSDHYFTAQPPKVYAQGVLVLWTAKSNIQPQSNLQLLLSHHITTIAIANPKTAPYGLAAEAIMKKYNIYSKIAGKIVIGESIAQASQFIATQAADIGFTAKAIVVSTAMKKKGRWIELNRKDYPTINQSAVFLKYGQRQHPAEAKKFYDFLYSEQAKSIYKKFGFIIN